MADVDIGVVIPAHNEAPSLRALAQELVAVLPRCARAWEIIVVDDGSTDETPAVLSALAAEDGRIRAVTLPCRRGKAAALAAGFAATAAEVVITLDADLQDDPEDIPRFLAALHGGHDLVCGWKRERRDPWRRRAASRVFNAVGSFVLGPHLHDHNCGFKAYRRAVIDALGMYGDLHRFATFLAHDLGFRVAEIPVHHRPRQFGRSRYGIERVWRFGFDLLTVALLARRRSRIFPAFAMTGAPLALAGLLLCAGMLFLSEAGAYAHMPRFLAGILAFLAGVQIVAAGLLGELILSIWRGRPRGRPRDAAALAVVPAGAFAARGADTAAAARRSEIEGALRMANVGPFEVTDAAGASGTALVIAPEGLGDIPEIAARVRAGPVQAVTGASGAAWAARGALLVDFPGTPRSGGELEAWFAGQGAAVRCVNAGVEMPRRARFLVVLRHFPLFFLARYHARPLHFFGAAGGLTAFAGLALGIAVKLSAIAGMRRYFLMELALGLAVAGIQLFVTGLLGELLAYARNTPARSGPPPAV